MTDAVIRYDCSKCPGYCCSYPRIAIDARDLARLARHFDLTVEQAARRFTRRYRADGIDERILRHRADPIYGSVCRFLDPRERRCSVYAARPGVCRQYPNGNRCGYFEFLRFERRQQGDPEFIPLA